MLHADIIKTVQQDLEQISADFTEYWLANPEELPVTLSYVTDARGVRDIVANGSLKAVHSGFGATASDIRYGINLVVSFLTERLLAETDPFRKMFCQDVLANLNPRGTWFKSFLIRFFEDERTARMAGGDCAGYALVLLTVDMGISRSSSGAHGKLRFGKAVYSQEEQLARLSSIYSACEDCYIDAIHMFGEDNKENFLSPCWDWFRQAAGELSMLFRDPSLAVEKEWVATALDTRPEAEQHNDNVEFELCDNAFVPHVRVRIADNPGTGKPGMPIHSVVIGCTVRSPAAEDGLRAFLRKNGLFQIVVKRASLQ